MRRSSAPLQRRLELPRSDFIFYGEKLLTTGYRRLLQVDQR
jgi:hypothetical protein